MRTKYDENGKFVLSLRDKDKNEIDSELTTLYESKLEDIAAKYERGGLDWVSSNHHALYEDIEQAENQLNNLWDQCIDKGTIDKFNNMNEKFFIMYNKMNKIHKDK